MTTRITGLEPEKCARRNRVAAKRDGVDAAPVRLLAGPPDEQSGERVITAKGVLPKDEGEALAIINRNRPGGSPLTADQVHIHYLEAASSRYIGDRFMFLDTSTLRNIAAGATDGFAFMNSHRTGAVSTPSELPFGRTFAGRYEHFLDASGRQHQRSLLGIYMLAGIKPNGENGPSTDDLHAAIDGGTVFDVSMGLYGGRRVCDVCGNELYSMDPETREYLCPHAPGTHRKMSREEREAQKARGQPEGFATYSLVDAAPGEVSAVYDGAVPGAGFRKAIGLSRRNKLSPIDLAEARHAYATLLSKGDLPDHAREPRARLRKEREIMPLKLMDAFRFWKAAGEPEEIDLDTFAAEHREPSPPSPPAPDPEADQIRKERDEFAAAAKLHLEEVIASRADAFVSEVVGKATATAYAQSLREAFVLAARDDHATPLASKSQRQDALRAAIRGKAAPTKEVGASDALARSRALPSDPATDPAASTPEQTAADQKRRAQNKAFLETY